MPDKEQVNHPLYYGGKDNPYEAIKVIEAWFLGFCLGNAVKYISRAGKKYAGQLEDLKKALWYLERERDGLGTTQPAVGMSMFPLECLPGDVVAAWALSNNLNCCIQYIAHSRLCGTSATALTRAIDFLKEEIQLIQGAP